MQHKTIYLHIGPPKTGSTSIQREIVEMAVRAEKNDYIYPESGRLMSGESYMVERSGAVYREIGPSEHHQILAWALENRVHGIDMDACWGELVNEISASDSDKVILSAEGFFHLNKSQIDRLADYLQDFNIKVIFYLRHPYSRAKSIYAQGVKVGKYFRGFSFFLKNYYCKQSKDQHIALQHWGECFGVENLMVRPFETIVSMGGLVEDFFNVVGVRRVKKKEAGRVENRSLNVFVLWLIRGINFVELGIGKPRITLRIFSKIRYVVIQSPFFNAMGNSIFCKRMKLDCENDKQLFKSAISEWYPDLVEKHVDIKCRDAYKI